MTYQQQLQDVRWYARRDEILERDDYCCQDCLRSPRNWQSSHLILQVHHREYFDGLMAWEYDDKYLVTLCKGCHSNYHGHTEDHRSERQKPVFIYGMRDFESQPARHISDVIREFVYQLANGK